eukprot:3932739-Rhodomonas_salina.3
MLSAVLGGAQADVMTEVPSNVLAQLCMWQVRLPSLPPSLPLIMDDLSSAIFSLTPLPPPPSLLLPTSLSSIILSLTSTSVAETCGATSDGVCGRQLVVGYNLREIEARDAFKEQLDK